MERSRRTGLVALFCVALLMVGPTAGAAQQSSAIAGQSPFASQTEVDGGAQPATACFDGAGSEFFIGPPDGTHIWVRLHAGGLTDSGWSIGAEMIGSTDGASIVEIVAGIKYDGDGFLDALTSPIESFELVKGFDFQLPMLAAMTGEFTDGGSDGGDGAEDGDARAGDSRFEMLRC